MRFACWITKTTDTHSEYVIFMAFLREQWLPNAPQCYVYTYIVSLVLLSKCSEGPWGPPGLLNTGTAFSGCKMTGGRVADHSHPSPSFALL